MAEAGYDFLSLNELEWAHAEFSLLRSQIDPVVHGLMNDDLPEVRAAGQDLLKVQKQVEIKLSRLQAQIRRLNVPEEGDTP